MWNLHCIELWCEFFSSIKCLGVGRLSWSQWGAECFKKSCKHSVHSMKVVLLSLNELVGNIIKSFLKEHFNILIKTF